MATLCWRSNARWIVFLVVGILCLNTLLPTSLVKCQAGQEKDDEGASKTNEEDEDDAEPAFPELINWNEKKLKIVSEIIEPETQGAAGSQTHEEYLDLNSGRAAFVLTTRAGYRVKFLDADEGLAFTYRPYKCRVERISDIPGDLRVPDALESGQPQAQQMVWNYNAHVSASPECDRASACKRRGERDMRLFGVSALWFEASDKPKTFARAQIIYSAVKNVYRQSLLWTYRDERNKLNIKFYFIEHRDRDGKKTTGGLAQLAGGQPTLEMIKIESLPAPGGGEPKLLRTINILSIDHALADEESGGGGAARGNLLSVPLGFGCFSSLSDELVDEVRQKRSHASLNGGGGGEVGGSNLWEGHAELEVTATKHEYDAQKQGGQVAKRSSDTYSVELAQSSISGYGLQQKQATHVKLVRWRNTREDRKLVLHHLFQVRYALDMRRGTCDMSHMASFVKDNQVAEGEVVEQAAPIKFKNGLQFDANVELFTDSEDLHFIKESASGYDKRGLTLHYYEGTAGSDELRSWLASGSLAGDAISPSRTRVIRAYEVHEYDDASATGGGELRSVTIWLLNEDESRIEQSYQIYVVSSRQFNPTGHWLEKAKLFDISRECYLQNERMLQNRDYVWITTTYPAPTRLLDVVARSQRQLKEIYYTKFMGDFTRAPKVEILMEEDSFRVRTLILDLPSVELLYDKAPGMVLEPAYPSGDMDFMAPDLGHCAHLCQTNACTIMSYCESAHTCFVSSRNVYLPQVPGQPKPNIVLVKGCDTYKITWNLEMSRLHRVGRLVAVMASLQHQSYGPAPAGMPEVPDEVSLPIEESRLTESERREAVNDYMGKLNEWLRANNRLPKSAFALELAGHFHLLLASKFELEQDPLDEFSLHELTSGGGSSAQELAELDGGDSMGRVPVFHKGLAMSRYNPSRATSLPKQDAALVQFQTMRGLNYDQCALACWDSKCGSFSHCAQARECVLSSVNSTSKARLLNLIDEDVDCFVAERDFLGNFQKFENVFRPQVYKLSERVPGGDPSECALNCVAQTNFRCLAFEYCQSEGEPAGAGECFYQTERHLVEGAAAVYAQTPAKPTGCDHYARSALADFLRLDSRQVEPQVLDQLKTSTFKSLSVFDCAEKCTSELVDCTGFQFCHVGAGGSDTPPTGAPPVRQCTTIESKVTADMLKGGGGSGDAKDTTSNEPRGEGVQDEETIVDERAGGEIVHAGKYLKFDANCQVFTMREDTAEAHLRDLAFRGLVRTARDKEAQAARARAGSSRGLTLFGGFLLYLAVVCVSASLVCLIILARDNQELLRQRWDRLRIVVGL